MTAPATRLVDAVAVQRFGDAWPLFNDAGRDVIRGQITDVLTAALAVGWTPPETPEPCTYTHSHTREWCGNPGCRET